MECSKRQKTLLHFFAAAQQHSGGSTTQNSRNLVPSPPPQVQSASAQPPGQQHTSQQLKPTVQTGQGAKNLLEPSNDIAICSHQPTASDIQPALQLPLHTSSPRQAESPPCQPCQTSQATPATFASSADEAETEAASSADCSIDTGLQPGASNVNEYQQQVHSYAMCILQAQGPSPQCLCTVMQSLLDSGSRMCHKRTAEQHVDCRAMRSCIDCSIRNVRQTCLCMTYCQ